MFPTHHIWWHHQWDNERLQGREGRWVGGLAGECNLTHVEWESFGKREVDGPCNATNSATYAAQQQEEEEEDRDRVC